MTEPTVEQLSCQELVELVTDYLEGALAPNERRRFDEHLELCDGCRRYVEQMRTTLRVTGALSPEAIGPDAEAALLRTFRRWNAG
jgi:anti-sigma factor RsiW